MTYIVSCLYRYLSIVAIIIFIAALDAEKSNFMLQIDGKDTFFTDDIKFQIAVNYTWECSKACAKFGNSCMAYSIFAMTCYGYEELHNPEEAPGAILYERIPVCILPGFELVVAWRKCIKIYTDRITQNQAVLACQSKGSTLLRLDKSEDTSVLKQVSSYWVNGRDVGVNGTTDWRWDNDELIDQAQWRPNEPNYYSEKCIAMNNYGFADVLCDRLEMYICETTF